MPIRISARHAMEQIANKAIEESGGVGGGTAEKEIIKVNTYNDLLSLTDKREGILYLVTNDPTTEDQIYIYDLQNNRFKSNRENFDLGTF